MHRRQVLIFSFLSLEPDSVSPRSPSRPPASDMRGPLSLLRAQKAGDPDHPALVPSGLVPQQLLWAAPY